MDNGGYRIERLMKSWFKGEEHPLDCVDFQTSTSLYEVKSCNLFVSGFNYSHKKKKQYKNIISNKLGRFFIKNVNHYQLKINADKENKIPKYIFVIQIKKQNVWRVKSWEEINLLIQKKKLVTCLRIKDIFI